MLNRQRFYLVAHCQKGEQEGEPDLGQQSEVRVQVLLVGCCEEAAFLLSRIALALCIKEVSSARF